MRLYIIRHAQSSNNALDDQTQRVYDPLLTDAGQRQATLLAAYLAGGESRDPGLRAAPASGGHHGPHRVFDRLLCSPMRRALLTTAPITEAMGIRATVWPDICEEGGLWKDHGGQVGVLGYPGITRSELQSQYPGFDVPPDLTEDGWWKGTREDDPAFIARVSRVAATLVEQAAAPETIAIVAHGGFITGLLRLLLRHAIEDPLFFHHDNTGITLLRFKSRNEVSVRYQNRVDHLPPELIT